MNQAAKSPPHLVLIDGPNYVFRAFHAIRHLTTKAGRPTNAIYGYVQMLRSVLEKLQPSHVAVAFDPKGGTFRNRIYSEYKSHRPPMPEELAEQWPVVIEVTQAFNFPLICIDNYEADDVIATLAQQAEKQGFRVTIVSTDKDLMQLVNDNIHMLDTMKDQHYDREAVKVKWGVYPERIQDLLAMTGDTADNIPGIPGIGPKTATLLLESYGTLEDVLNHAHEIKQTKRRETILASIETARLAYRLVALDDQTPIDQKISDLVMQSPDREHLARLFQALEFHRLYQEFASDEPATGFALQPQTSQQQPQAANDAHDAHAKHASQNSSNPITRHDHLVDTPAALHTLIEQLTLCDSFAVDTETTSLDPHAADLVGISIAITEGEAYYIPVGHRAADLLTLPPTQLCKEEVLSKLRPLLENPLLHKTGQNLKYDAQVLRRAGIELQGIRADAMLLAYCLQAGKYAPNLDALAKDFFDYQCIAYEDVVGKGQKQINFSHATIAAATPYACEDADISLRLVNHLTQISPPEAIQRHHAIELPLSRVLADMEWQGTKVDRNKLIELSTTFGAQIGEIQSAIHQRAGFEINIQSPKQLGELLFETLALPGGKKTKSGQWATGQSELEKLADTHEIPRLILEVRQLSKLKSTYTDALQKLIQAETGRVHTSYNQAITTTGRLSSSNPNLQNIPIRSAAGREIRKAFIAEADCSLIAADYSQIELRLMAHFSEDEALLHAFDSGIDIHTATAASVHQCSSASVTGEMRRHAKVINFGILYGMSAFGLAKQLGVSNGEAKLFIEAYFQQYPKVRDFMEAMPELARRQGYIDTLLGHRVHIPDIRASNGMKRQYAERTAINAPLQGSAADIIKVAMIQLHARLQEELPQAHIILQVHDELVVESPDHLLDQTTAIMREVMQQAVQLKVPLIADIGVGKNWFNAHQL
ncbi:MAG: DNA polymerase I [Zetaproteobacteria bacterium]|nr:DNA polymerase I [Zetaproteobacteria bacterium]